MKAAVLQAPKFWSGRARSGAVRGPPRAGAGRCRRSLRIRPAPLRERHRVPLPAGARPRILRRRRAAAGRVASPGDRVAVFPLLANPDDPLTEIGEPALGTGYDYFGSRRDGGMAELLYVPERNLFPVPAAMPLLHAAMVEPAAVALHAVLKLRVPANGSALVIGAGRSARWPRSGCASWAGPGCWWPTSTRKRRVMGELGFETIDAAPMTGRTPRPPPAGGGRGPSRLPASRAGAGPGGAPRPGAGADPG